MLQRILASQLRSSFASYPVVTVTGPRQSGKTTLCRTCFPHLPYVNLEESDVRSRATDDPRGFLARFPDGAILDEIQHAPGLPSYLLGIVDGTRRNGLFVLTGSQHLAVSQAVHQSLAGRTAVLQLLPFSIEELTLAQTPRERMSTDAVLLRGCYPRIWDHDLDPTRALADYYETYLHRDVRALTLVRDLPTFDRFVRLCAGRVGQLLNLSSLGNDAGVSHSTAREWIGLLEASYIVFRLQPWHTNVGKRLTKAPKLYFHDVGLATFLLGIEAERQIRTHPLRGALFENLVVSEAMKFRLNRHRQANLFFYREAAGLEIDLLWSAADDLRLLEIKSGATANPGFFAVLETARARLAPHVSQQALVYDGAESFRHRDVEVTNPGGLPTLFAGWDRESG